MRPADSEWRYAPAAARFWLGATLALPWAVLIGGASRVLGPTTSWILLALGESLAVFLGSRTSITFDSRSIRVTNLGQSINLSWNEVAAVFADERSWLRGRNAFLRLRLVDGEQVPMLATIRGGRRNPEILLAMSAACPSLSIAATVPGHGPNRREGRAGWQSTSSGSAGPSSDEKSPVSSLPRLKEALLLIPPVLGTAAAILAFFSLLSYWFLIVLLILITIEFLFLARGNRGRRS